jgi:hypothetical protein
MMRQRVRSFSYAALSIMTPSDRIHPDKARIVSGVNAHGMSGMTTAGTTNARSPINANSAPRMRMKRRRFAGSGSSPGRGTGAAFRWCQMKKARNSGGGNR